MIVVEETRVRDYVIRVVGSRPSCWAVFVDRDTGWSDAHLFTDQAAAQRRAVELIERIRVDARPLVAS